MRHGSGPAGQFAVFDRKANPCFEATKRLMTVEAQTSNPHKAPELAAGAHGKQHNVTL